MIKKTINYCWFGGNEKSDLIKKCISSWKEKCPEYEIIEWNENNFDLEGNLYVKEAYENKKWAFVSDYARLWVLYNHGGIYLDTDVELLKNIDELLKYNSFFATEDNKFINTGLGCGAEEKNNLIKIMLDDYKNIRFINNKKMDLTPCPVRNTDSLKKIIDFNGVIDEQNIYDNNIILSKEYFCPLDYETKKLNITKKTYAIHWYNESWLPLNKRIKKRVYVIIRNLIGERLYKKIKLMIKG